MYTYWVEDATDIYQSGGEWPEGWSGERGLHDEMEE